MHMSKGKKRLLVLLAFIVSFVIPVFAQWHLNAWFRDTFNPDGWRVLQPHLRLMSMLVCYLISYAAGYAFLFQIGEQLKARVYVIHALYSFCWVGFCAFLCYVIATG